MGRFNGAVSLGDQLRALGGATQNHESGLAFTLDPKSALYTRACATMMGEDKFYTDAQTSDAELVANVQAVANVDPEFVLRLAAYARQEMNIRSTPIALLCEAAAIPACKPFVRRWTPEIVRRADEPGEVIAYWTRRHGHVGARGPKGGEHAFPNSLTRGLEDALLRFNEYHVGKYDRNNCAVSLRDVLRIVRPSTKSAERSALYRYVVKGEMDADRLPLLAAKAKLLQKEQLDAEALQLARDAHVTWEVLTSKFGSSAAVWDALDLPFMAGMRNLSNLMRNGAHQALDRVLRMFHDPEHVRRSKQLPFRFFTAYQAVETGQRFDHKSKVMVRDNQILNHPRRAEVLAALLKALELSMVNLPRLPGKSFITSDNSGSMEATLSEKSSVRRCDTANLLASMTHTLCEQSVCSVFGEYHKVVPIVREDSIITNMMRLKSTDVDHSTNAWLTVKYLRENGIRVDRIILFSDMQCYHSNQDVDPRWYESVRNQSLAEELRRYRSSVNPGVYMYSVDLAGYGTAQFPQDEPRVALLSGWSEKLLEFIPQFEADGIQAVDRIGRWEPPHRLPSIVAHTEIETELSVSLT